MRFFKWLAPLVLILGSFIPAEGAESAGRNWQIASGDLVFGAGGVSGRFLYFQNWDADNNGVSDRNWAIDTLLEHDGEIWWAETDPALADEPGVSTAWVQLSGGGGGGATITAGTTDPTGGASGDAHIQVDASDEVQSLWRNGSGTWEEYTIPSAGTSTDDQTAAEVPVTTTNFSGNLSGTDDSVQDALETIDDLSVTSTVTTSSPVSGDGSVGDPVTIANQAIGHTKIGSSVGGSNQAAGRILEADGAGDVRWANKGGGGGSGDALSSIDFPVPDSTNVYDVIDHLGHLYQNHPEAIGVAVTWSASVDGDDVSSLWGESNGTYRFRGIEYVSNVTSPQSGDVILLPTGGFRHRGATRFSHLSNPIGWVGGPYADEDEANSHVTGTNDVSAYDNALQLVTAFTAGTIHYQWVNIVDEIEPVHELSDAEVVDSASDVQGIISGSQLDDFAPELGVAEATSKVDDEFGRVSGRRIGEAIDAHVVPSTNATTDVAETSAIGTSVELSRDDHTHRLPTDDTLHWDGSDQLAVNINDIIERVSETVRYFTDSTGNFDTSSHATMGEEYTTSRWQKAIHKVQIHIGHQGGDGNLVYRAGVYEVEEDGEIITVFGRSAIRDVGNSGLWVFNFHPPVIVDPLARIIIVATREDEGNTTTARVLEGSESGDSPDISYMDAGEDFDRVHRVTYTEDYPVVGTTRHSHDAAFIRGNIKIYYTNTYHEGLLVGEDSVNAAHIDSESAGATEFLGSDGSGGAEWKVPAGGGGAITQATETALGGVRGASALQAISSSGTDILGWSVNRMGQFVSVALPAMTQADIDNATTGRRAVTGALIAANAGSGGGGGGSGYGDWTDIGSVTGSISGNPVTITLDSGEDIDDYEELYIHIEANDTNDQRVASPRFRASEVPVTTLAGGGLGIPFAGNNTDEGAVLVRRNTDGTELTLDVYGSVINFPATSVTTINARELTAGGGGGGGTDDQTAAEVSVDTSNFTQNLTTLDATVQDALETIDGFTQYQGAWQQASWPAGVIVTRSGIAYISLVNSNTEIPTPASTQWSGLPEGFSYRGEAPVAATNYNYGHVVFSPDTDNYYFFTSTISASVARADIPTHANFAPVTHKLTNAEATDDLSTVYGAVTGELIAGAVAAHEDVANSAALVYTQNTRNLALTVGRTIGADLSSQVVLPALTQTQAEDATSTVPGLVTGELMAQAVAAGGGGGSGGSPDRIVLASSVGVSNTAGPHEIALTEAMVARQLISFFVFSSVAASPDGIGYLLSDDILALTAEATAPTDAGNALPVVTASYSASNFSQQSGNYFVYRKDDSTLWVRPTRLAAHTLTITATPLGGGLSTSEQQSLVNESRLVDTEIISSTNALTTTATSTPMDSVPRDTFNFATIPIEDFERIDLGLELDGTFDFVVPIRISRQMMLDIPTTPADLYPDGGTTTRRLQAVYWSGRVSAGINSEIGTAVTRPIFTWVDSRRNNGLESLSIAFTKNVDGDISQMHTYASSDVTMRLVYAVIRHYED